MNARPWMPILVTEGGVAAAERAYVLYMFDLFWPWFVMSDEMREGPSGVEKEQGENNKQV